MNDANRFSPALQTDTLSVGDQILNGDHLDTVLLGKSKAVIATRHASGRIILLDKFTDAGNGRQFGKLAEINASLSMAKAFEGPIGNRTERQDMARTGKVLGTAGRIGEFARGQSTVLGRNASGGAMDVVNRDGVGGPHQFRIAGHHQWQV
jgi:hypothetical protein